MKIVNFNSICKFISLSALIIIFISCSKNEENSNAIVTDHDGNKYNTVKIGNQIWMSENLKTTTYRNGDAIPNITDPTAWYNLSTAAYCDYDNNPANSATYGKLYNWHAVHSGQLCPMGWHIPSEAEWNILEAFLGEESLAGGKLKEKNFTHWQSPNTAATNETGFTGLPGGFRSSTGAFFNLSYNGYWWGSETGSDISYARYHYLDFNIGFLLENEDYKVDGLSVRCIKD